MWEPFKILVMDRSIAFDFRPWGTNHGSKELPYLTLFLWAVKQGFAAFLLAIQDYRPGTGLLQYCNYARTLRQTPLSIAISSGNLEVVKLLNEADPETIRTSEMKLVWEAIDNSQEEILKY